MSLPFQKFDDNGSLVSAWDVTPTGDWSKDCETGRSHFNDALFFATMNGRTQLIAATLRAITEKGLVSGIEIGFFQACSDELTGG